MLPRMLREAVEEATEAAKWYGMERIDLSNEFLDQLAATLEAVQQLPLRFPKLETAPEIREIRRAKLQRFPYLVVFEMVNTRPVVLAIMHTSRSPDYWIERTR